MFDNSQWNRIGVVAGVVSAIVGIFALVVTMGAGVDPQQPSDTERANNQLDTVAISPAEYDIAASRWQPYGPFYEGSETLRDMYGLTHRHLYGSSTGRTVYTPVLNAPGTGRASLTARLSADAVGYSGGQGEFSDVELLVNSHSAGVRRVIPDDARGARYTWQFSADLLRQGNNTIEFKVSPDAEFPNGLCIYGDSLLPDGEDERIVLSIPRKSS